MSATQSDGKPPEVLSPAVSLFDPAEMSTKYVIYRDSQKEGEGE
jgi:hypothetical protein